MSCEASHIAGCCRLCSKVPKRYEVKVKGQPNETQIERMRRGIIIDGRKTARAEVRLLEQSATNAWFEVILHEGRNQQIRKMFDAVGHSVMKLRRLGIGFLSLEKEKLPVGAFRLLHPTEVQRFFRSASPAKKTKSASNR